MAVYTPVSADQCAAFLARYDQVGEYRTHQGILRGVENSNFFVETTRGQFVLTLYERRVEADDLPFYLGFSDHLARAGLPTPRTLRQADGAWSSTLCGRPAALVSRLAGESLDEAEITPALALEAGRIIAEMQGAAAGFKGTRANNLGRTAWGGLLQEAQEQASRGEQQQENADLLKRAERVLQFCQNALGGAESLPSRVVHADLFCDNFLARTGVICGVIDFYFACDESLAYDLAVAGIAWGGDKAGGLALAPLEALLSSYRQTRAQENNLPALGKDEQEAWCGLCAGAGLRFFLTRFIDLLIAQETARESAGGALQVAVKDPLPMLALAETFAFGALPKEALL